MTTTDRRPALATWAIVAFATVFAVAVTIAQDKLALADMPADLNDAEIAHVAYTADVIDIRYAHLALGISQNPAIREFAMTMIRDHEAVNKAALDLVGKLGVAPQDNFLSQSLNEQADQLVDEMRQLTGSAFDRRYAENELAYHGAVNGLLEGTFIPNIENAEVKALFVDALAIFETHERHAAMMVGTLQTAQAAD